MAKLINNPIMQGSTGRVGKIFFRRTVFGTVIANMPDYKQRKTLSPKQAAYRQRFKEGTAYIKAKIEDPLFVAKYTGRIKRGHTAYLTAFADYMSPPQIHQVNISRYKGQPGDEISIHATDNFDVELVYVQITCPSGNVLESGFATFAAFSPYWVYTATNANAHVAGSIIDVRATDLSGATTTEQVTIV